MNTEKKNNLKDSILDFFKTILVTFVVVFVVTRTIVRPIIIQGDSMYPTLKDGNYGLSSVYKTIINDIERFDVVILKTDQDYIVKRVIGMPYETVEYRDNQLYINGEPVDEPFLNTDYVHGADGDFTEDIEAITLDGDEFYCLGDNRPNSRDSRWYGPFKDYKIEGVVDVMVWPFKLLG